MRGFLVIGVLVLSACASTKLPIPDNHPANAKAATPPIATSKVLRSDFDPFADGSEPSAPKPHHHHGGSAK